VGRHQISFKEEELLDMIELGDLWMVRGSLAEADKAFRSALKAAEDTDERDLAVAYNRVGDVLVAQGNLPEALKSYRESPAIFDRLAKVDPGNAGWQRDLAVSYGRVATVEGKTERS
jgi:tetratricopeptide (TPR) repeat protein